jgi:hypothetical protein
MFRYLLQIEVVEVRFVVIRCYKLREYSLKLKTQSREEKEKRRRRLVLPSSEAVEYDRRKREEKRRGNISFHTKQNKKRNNLKI